MSRPMSYHTPDLDFLAAFVTNDLSEGAALVARAQCELRPDVARDVAMVAALKSEICANEWAASEGVAMSSDALSLALARIERPESDTPAPDAPTIGAHKVDLPDCLKGFDLPPSLTSATYGKKRSLGQGVWLLPLALEGATPNAKTYLMYVAPNMTMPLHDHHGEELTLVLSGSFSDGTATYHRGDLVTQDSGQAHAPMIGDEACLCLFAAEGPIRPKTLLGRLLQPFAGI